GLPRTTKIIAIGVCDSPAYFYHHIDDIAASMGVPVSVGHAEDWLEVWHGSGEGYGVSTAEELQYLADVARTTGVLLDPVYSGKKALHSFVHKVVAAEPERFRGRRILFWHTGGALGMFDKAEQLTGIL
ncbi:unnamed protein product, partial [Phaeothamnion confervicola]